MFKQVLSQLSESVVGGAKDYAKQKFSPKANKERAQEFLIENIRNLGARSPILSGVTTAIADNMASIAALDKLHDQQIESFLKSEKSAPMRESIKTQLGPNATDKKVEREITKILTEIHTLINKEGDVKIKENEFYKKNEKFVAEYQKSVLESLKQSNTQTNTRTDSTTSTTQSAAPEDNLDAIAKNTNQTVNLLEIIHDKGIKTGADDTDNQPVTIKGAVQNIGGTFLNKVFDEKTIEKFATSAQNVFNKSKSTDKPTVVTQDTTLQAKVKAEAAAKEALVEKTKITDSIESKKISIQEDIAEAVIKTEKLEESRETRESKEKSSIEANKTTDTKTVSDSVESKEKSSIEANKTTDTKTVSDSVESKEKSSTGYTNIIKDALVKKQEKNKTGFEPKVRSRYNSSKEILNSLRNKESQTTDDETEKENTVSAAKTEGKQTSILEQILEEIKKLNSKEKEPGVTTKERDRRPLLDKALDTATDKITDYAARKLPGLAKTTRSGAGRVAGAVRSGIGSVISAGGRAASYLPTIARGAGALATGAGGLLSSAAGGIGSLASGAGGLLSSAAGGIGSLASGAATGLGSLAGGSALTAGAGLAAAGAGGYALGKYAINPLIDKGLSAVTGSETSLGSWIYDKMNPEANFDKPVEPESNIVYNSETAKAAHEKLIKEETQYTNDDKGLTPEYKKAYLESIQKNPPRTANLQSIESAKEIAKTKAMAVAPMYSSQTRTKNSDGSTTDVAAKSTTPAADISTQTTIETQKKAPATEVTRLSDVKEKQEANAQAKSAQPIVINNTTAAPPAAPAQQTPVVASSIRNQDSTFERVQMQDFWARSR